MSLLNRAAHDIYKNDHQNEKITYEQRMPTICYHIQFLFRYFLSLHMYLIKPALSPLSLTQVLSQPCPVHQDSEWEVESLLTGNSAYAVSSIGVSSCFSFLNHKWNRGRKKLSFDVLALQSDRPMLLRPSHFCFFSVCMNKHSGYNEFATFKQFFKSLLAQNCLWMSTQTPFFWSSFSPIFLVASSPH